jgi:hypothetical protein
MKKVILNDMCVKIIKIGNHEMNKIGIHDKTKIKEKKKRNVGIMKIGWNKILN